MFGYALDGYPVHSPFSDAELADVELDDCNGHTTEADGYHYHANSAKKNQVIACLGRPDRRVSDEAGGPARRRPGARRRMTGPVPRPRSGHRPLTQVHRTMPSRARHVLVALTATATLLTITACGSTSTDTSPDDSRRPPTAGQAAVDPTSLFADGALTSEPKTVDCTLENGSETTLLPARGRQPGLDRRHRRTVLPGDHQRRGRHLGLGR